MSDLNYTVSVGVEGGEDVQTLRDNVNDLNADVDNLDGTAKVTIESEGVTETAEGIDTIATSDAAGALDDVGTAAEGAQPKVEGAGGAFKDMFAAVGLVNVASFGLDFIMGQLAEKAARIKAMEAFDAAQVQTFADALRQAGDDAANLVTALEDGGGALTAMNQFGEEFDFTADLAEANITADEFFRTLRDDGAAGYDALIQKAKDAGLSEGEVNRIRVAAGETLDNLGASAELAAASNEVYADSQLSANAALQAFLDSEDPMRRFGDEWALLKESISDGSLDTTAAADALNTLKDGLNLSREEVLALAQAEIDEGVAGAQAYNEAIGSIDFRNADVQGATSAFQSFTAGLFAGENQAQAAETAYANMVTAVGDGALNLNVATESGRAQQDALEGVAAVLDGQLAQAYDNANGSQADFTAAATVLGNETLARLQTDLGLTDEQVAGLATTLGLTAADYEARFELAGAAEAQLQIGLLQGAISGLPPETELAVNTLILQGDYVGARDAIASYYADNPAVLGTEANTTAAEDDIDAVATAEHPTTITAAAETVAAATDLLDTAAETRIATIAAHALTIAARLDLEAAANEERTATIRADAQTGDAEAEINQTARTRTAYINVVTRGTTGGGGGSGFGQGAFGAAPPAGARGEAGPMGAEFDSGTGFGGSSPTVVIERIIERTPANIILNAAVIGNPFDVMRAVRDARDENERLNGDR